MDPLMRQVQRILAGKEDRLTYAASPGWLLTAQSSLISGSVKYHDLGYMHSVSEAQADGGVLVQDRRMFDALRGLGVYNVATAPVRAYPRAVLLDGATMYLRLGETSGTVALDMLATNNGTYTGTYTLGQSGSTGGDSNPSVAFDPGYVTISTINLSGDFTLEAWTNLGADASTNPSGNNPVFTLGNGSFIARPAGASFQCPGDSAAAASLTTSNNVGVWVHWAYVRQASTFFVYRNGVQIATGSCTANSLVTVTGVGGNATTGMRGNIDEAAVYQSALSAAQVANHFGISGQSSGAMAMPGAVSTSVAAATVRSKNIVSLAVATSTSVGAASIVLIRIVPLAGAVSTSAASLAARAATKITLGGPASTSTAAATISVSGTSLALSAASSSASTISIGPVDGGTPSTVSWSATVDGGTPPTVSWPASIDGGHP